MAIPSVPPILPRPIADAGDVRTILDTTPTGSNQISFQSGFPPITSNPLSAGGIPPQREDFNAAFKMLSQHSLFLQSGGVYPWQGADGDFPGLNYQSGWHVTGSNGHEYIAQQPSGPDISDGSGGFVGPKDPVADDGTYWLDFTIALQFEARYDLGEFYFFRHPTLKPGFQPCQGGLLSDVATLYPEIWAYLQTSEGQLLCKSEADWQAMTTAIWATLADGTTVGWDGIGGAPYYVQDLAAGTLRLPDLRGMYAEAAGFDSLGVGGVHGWGMPRLTGNLPATLGAPTSPSGVIAGTPFGLYLQEAGAANSRGTYRADFDSARQAPVAAKVQPRAFGALACVYLGRPAS